MQEGKKGWAQAQQLKTNVEMQERGISISCPVTLATPAAHIQHFWSHGGKIYTVTLMSPSRVVSPQSQAAYKEPATILANSIKCCFFASCLTGKQ